MHPFNMPTKIYQNRITSYNVCYTKLLRPPLIKETIDSIEINNESDNIELKIIENKLEEKEDCDDEINDESNIIETIESEHETDNDPDPEPEPETKKKKLKSRKCWIAFTLKPKGAIRIV